MIENKPRKLRIMWASNAIHVPTGYGMASLDMFNNFRQAGWTPENFSFVDTAGINSGKPKDEFGFTHFPLINHVMGSDAQRIHSERWNADVVVGLYDVWPQNPQDLQQIKRWIVWLPVDYDPVPMPILAGARSAYQIVAMSKFGQTQLKEAGFASTFIPHGVNTNIFKPMDQKAIREKLHIDPKTYIFGMVSENKAAVNPRKSYQQVLEAFKKVLEKRPNTYLYIHTDPDFPGGFPLKQFISYLGIGERVGFPDTYHQKYETTKEEIAQIYNTIDCLVNPSATEGFGIPIVEAMSCGKPVIVQDWTAMSELIEDGITGYKVPPHFKIWYPIGSYVCYPKTEDVFNSMMKVMDYRGDKWEKPCRDFVLKNYDQDKLFEERWLKIFEDMEQEIYGSPTLTNPQKKV
ncbi:MAG: glycosyltransferase family 4 protein [Thaumarchaeota archaeon]|nr:glycosyltransferase family 4 protein [Nitrososphaerota archaeon]